MPKIFKILNLSPDSFSDGDQALLDPVKALNKAQALIDQRANFIDIGAESTRPGASSLSDEEEWSRLKGFLQSYDLDLPLSLDSRKPRVIAQALELNPRLLFINDVSAMQNPELLRVLADFGDRKLSYIAMHSYGGIPPRKAKDIPDDYYAEYGGLQEHMLRFFAKTISLMQSYDLDPQKLILDPGLGFGKNLRQSFEILEIIPKLKKEFAVQILLGPSRKSFLKLWKNNPNASLPELDSYTLEFCNQIQNEVDYFRLH